MGNNQGQKLPQNSSQVTKQKTAKVDKKVEQNQSSIVQSKQQAQYGLPQGLHDKQKVRQCIDKYNDKIELQMKKQYVQDFFNMREKLLLNMQGVCKESYPIAKGKVAGKELKECMQSVQSLITEQDERMQVQFGMKLFLLADKCLLKQERKTKSENQQNKKQAKPINPIDKCVDKLVKYRNLNMEMHILKLELARELL